MDDTLSYLGLISSPSLLYCVLFGQYDDASGGCRSLVAMDTLYLSLMCLEPPSSINQSIKFISILVNTSY